jgi:hypothetical protein
MGTTGNINIYDGFNFCTTLEQSKSLLELGLNPETSDMTYLTGIRDGEEEIYGILPYKELEPDCRKGNILYKNVPAWTYYKLLTLLPKEYILFSQRSIGINIPTENIISVNLHEGVEGLLTIIKNEEFIERINKEFLIKEDNNTVKKTWHRVKEKFPPEGEQVLVRLKNYNYSPRIMFYRKRDNIWVEEDDVYFDCYVNGDDLWTLIPDLEG